MTFAVTALLLGQNPALVMAAENATVQSVRVSADSVYIATDKPVQYKAFTMEHPPKLVLELMDAKMKTLQEIPVNGGALRRVRTGQFQTSPVSIYRIVMDLTQKTVYQITRKGTELVVMLGARTAAAQTPAVKDTPADVPAGVKVIVPQGAAPKPVEVTLESSPVKPSDLNSESSPAPVVHSKSRVYSSSSRNIMEILPRDPITIDYNEADVREVLDMMAAKAGINMIYGDDVNGTITISLSKVPFDEAFKTLLNMKGLAAQQTGDNILRIASPTVFVAEERKAMPQSRVFFLNYSKADDIKVQIDAVATAENRTSAKCTADDTNNAVIVTDTAFGLDSTERLIRSLDRVPKQVVIEAKLVEVTLDNEFDMGVNWGVFGQASKNTVGSLVGYTGVDNTGAAATYALPGQAEVGTGVSLASKNIAGGFRFGRLASGYMLDMTIQAAASKGKAKVLSDPKVATLNNKEANINITNQTPYITQEVTQGTGGTTSSTKVTYITTGITLKVTPTINSDGRITMKINPSVSQPSQAVAFTAPSVDTRSTDTNVIVKNGETIVIGGLIHDAQSDNVTKVPVLGDIPLLGVLFRKKSTSRNRMELLIFVTPKIIED